jgi:hypothetical protein
MQARDGVFLEDLCPKLRARRWRSTLHLATEGCCLYCGNPSESIDHVHPLSRGGLSVTENCVPACLACNGSKGDTDAFTWYRQQRFYDPRRAMALKAWTDGDQPLALRLLSWASPAAAAGGGRTETGGGAQAGGGTGGGSGSGNRQERRIRPHQTRQASTPAWRWQIAS